MDFSFSETSINRQIINLSFQTGFIQIYFFQLALIIGKFLSIAVVSVCTPIRFSISFAKYLNLQGIKKIPRQNGTLETWSSHFIRLILDNPVYCGKIAYGRRTREKVKGTKNEYKQVHTDDYILEDGQHEGIVSEELWQKAHTKRMATGIKQPSKIGKDRSHLLTGILKCPICGSSMYTNKHAWTNKDGTYKEVYYYICGRNKQERGHHCDYKASLRKTDIEPLVIEAVKELVSDKYFEKR